MAQTSTTNQFLLSVQFVDAMTGWAVGVNGTILKTSNGGTTWASQFSGTFEPLRSVHFFDGQVGWAAGSKGTILATINGGGS